MYTSVWDTVHGLVDRLKSLVAENGTITAEKLANELGCSLRVFPADWEKYGKSAGVRRNEQMAIYSDAVIVFWDGFSRGTQNMAYNAVKHNCDLRINLYNQTN